MVTRLSTSLVKRGTIILPLVALIIGLTPRLSVNAEDKESAEARNARYNKLRKQIDSYYTVDSPWKRADDIELESTLLHLMDAEVHVWQLEDNLRDRNDDNASNVSSIGTPLHEEVLVFAEKALVRLRARPNVRLLDLLIAHLETYPYDWAQEGDEDLLPNLKKLRDTRRHGVSHSRDS